jgi:hypothetical protein
MKTFIFTITKSNNRSYGGRNETAEIYRIKKNIPIHVATAKWCTAGYKGADSEVLSALVNAGEIPKKFDGYYNWSDNNGFKIKQIGY